MTQRTIKFRAWVKNEDLFGKEAKEKWPNGFMFVGFGFSNVDSGHDEANTWCENERWEEPVWDKAILMQFTGLKDKNGKEIYEGDIMEGYNPIYRAIAKGVVQFEEEHGMYTGQNSQSEIIGNVYENPNLLN